MTISHPRGRYLLRRVGLACASVMLIATLSAAPTAAQISAADKAKLEVQGFVAADFKSVNLALVAPHYTFYRAWQQCLSGTIPAVLHLQPPNFETLIKFTRLDCDPHLATLRASLARQTGLPQADRPVRLLNTYLANGLRDIWEERKRQAANPPPPRREPDPPAPANWKIQRTSKNCVAAYSPPGAGLVEIYVVNNVSTYDLILRRHRREDAPEGTLYIISMATPEGLHRAQKAILSSYEDGTEWLKITLDDADRFYLKRATYLSIRPVALKNDTKEGFDVSAVTEELMGAISQCRGRG